MWKASRSLLCSPSTKKTVIFTGPSVRAKYHEALKKLNIGLACHVVGGSFMLLSSAVVGGSPIPAAIFAGLLWMQVISTAKVTELGTWVNLCKNIVRIERIDHENDVSVASSSKLKLVITTDGSKLSIETDSRDESSDVTPLPSFKQLKELGIIHVNDTALSESDASCIDLFNRDDIVVTLNEGSKQLVEPPPGASKVLIPKLAEIYQKRERAINSENKRIASLMANVKPTDPALMIERLGTASMAVGAAVFVLGGGMFLASESKENETSRLPYPSHQNST
jgi:hypothetical protein